MLQSIASTQSEASRHAPIPLHSCDCPNSSQLLILTLLIAMGCVAFMSYLTIGSSGLRASLQKVENQRAASEIEQMQRIVTFLMEMCEKQEARLQEELKQEDKLLERVRQSYIDSNEEEDEIQQLSKLTKKLAKHKKYLAEMKQQLQQVKHNYEQQYAAVAAQFIHRESQIKAELIAVGTTIKELLQNHLDQLQQTIPKLHQWLIQSQAELDQQEEKPQDDYLDQNMEFLNEYKTMPLLARMVLNPDPSLFLSTLYSHHQDLSAFLDQREYFYQSRLAIIKQNPSLESLSLIKYSMVSGREENNWGHDVVREWERVKEKWGTVEVERGMCLVVPSFNNGRQYRVELNLNSIFAQNYSNYHVVIVDDASTDDTVTLIRKYLDFHRIPPSKAMLLTNSRSKKALENIYTAAMEHCQQQEVVVVVDGDDQLIGFNVLQVLNAAYSCFQAGFLYSNFYYYQYLTQFVKPGFTAPYTQKEKQDAAYRDLEQKFSHLITFRRDLLSALHPADLKDEQGRFYDVAYDFALAYPLMELSCGKVERIDEYQYLYNIGTGLNDYQIQGKRQETIGKAILTKQRYTCATPP